MLQGCKELCREGLRARLLLPPPLSISLSLPLVRLHKKRILATTKEARSVLLRRFRIFRFLAGRRYTGKYASRARYRSSKQSAQQEEKNKEREKEITRNAKKHSRPLTSLFDVSLRVLALGYRPGKRSTSRRRNRARSSSSEQTKRHEGADDRARRLLRKAGGSADGSALERSRDEPSGDAVRCTREGHADPAIR